MRTYWYIETTFNIEKLWFRVLVAEKGDLGVVDQEGSECVALFSWQRRGENPCYHCGLSGSVEWKMVSQISVNLGNFSILSLKCTTCKIASTNNLLLKVWFWEYTSSLMKHVLVAKGYMSGYSTSIWFSQKNCEFFIYFLPMYLEFLAILLIWYNYAGWQNME